MKTMLQLYEFIAVFDKLLLFMKFGTDQFTRQEEQVESPEWEELLVE